MNAIPSHRQQRARDGRGAQALLPLEHGEEQGRERDEGEHGLAEPCMQVDERVVREAECAAEDHEPVEQGAEQRAPARELEPHDCHHRGEQRGREHETQRRAPQRIELPVAEANAHRIAPGEHGLGDERRECDALALELTQPGQPGSRTWAVSRARRGASPCGRASWPGRPRAPRRSRRRRAWGGPGRAARPPRRRSASRAPSPAR